MITDGNEPEELISFPLKFDEIFHIQLLDVYPSGYRCKAVPRNSSISSTGATTLSMNIVCALPTVTILAEFDEVNVESSSPSFMLTVINDRCTEKQLELPLSLSSSLNIDTYMKTSYANVLDGSKVFCDDDDAATTYFAELSMISSLNEVIECNPIYTFDTSYDPSIGVELAAEHYNSIELSFACMKEVDANMFMSMTSSADNNQQYFLILVLLLVITCIIIFALYQNLRGSKLRRLLQIQLLNWLKEMASNDDHYYKTEGSNVIRKAFVMELSDRLQCQHIGSHGTKEGDNFNTGLNSNDHVLRLSYAMPSSLVSELDSIGVARIVEGTGDDGDVLSFATPCKYVRLIKSASKKSRKQLTGKQSVVQEKSQNHEVYTSKCTIKCPRFHVKEVLFWPRGYLPHFLEVNNGQFHMSLQSKFVEYTQSTVGENEMSSEVMALFYRKLRAIADNNGGLGWRYVSQKMADPSDIDSNGTSSVSTKDSWNLEIQKTDRNQMIEALKHPEKGMHKYLFKGMANYVRQSKIRPRREAENGQHISVSNTTIVSQQQEGQENAAKIQSMAQSPTLESTTTISPPPTPPSIAHAPIIVSISTEEYSGGIRSSPQTRNGKRYGRKEQQQQQQNKNKNKNKNKSKKRRKKERKRTGQNSSSKPKEMRDIILHNYQHFRGDNIPGRLSIANEAVKLMKSMEKRKKRNAYYVY